MHNIPYYDQKPLNSPNSAHQAFIHSPWQCLLSENWSRLLPMPRKRTEPPPPWWTECENFHNMTEERESGSVTGAQQCGVTLLRHEGIGAWRQSLTSRSLVNEERFLCACVCPCSSMWLSWRVCEHVDEAAALSISAIYTFLNSGALVKHFHEGNQWQRKEGRKTRREWVKTSQKKVWWSGAHGFYKETLVWKCLKKTCLTVVMHRCVSEWVTEFCRRDASTHEDTQFGTA